jgi:hypothetical protein
MYRLVRNGLVAIDTLSGDVFSFCRKEFFMTSFCRRRLLVFVFLPAKSFGL